MKWLAFALLALGEFGAIYGELWITTTNKWWWPATLYVISVTPLLAGYTVGYKAFDNDIWPVTVLSIGSILLVEPVLAYFMFNTLPKHGALVGMILATSGIIITTVWR